MVKQTTMPSRSETQELEGASAGSALPVRLETDLLIIGAGPAGASLACFLAQHGMYILRGHAAALQ
jgi:hypothetical protein